MTSTERELTVNTVLDYCDGPILFTAHDANELNYICVFLRTHDGGTDFLCTRVVPTRLAKFLAGEMDLRSTILEAPPREYFSLTTTENDQRLVATPILIDSIPPYVLPASDYFISAVPAPTDEAREKALAELARIKRELQETISRHREAEEALARQAKAKSDQEAALVAQRLSIEASLEMPGKEAVIDSYTLSAFLKAFQDFIKCAYKKQISNLRSQDRKAISAPSYYNTQVYGSKPGSFTVLLRSEHTTDLAQRVDLERAFEKADEVLKWGNNTEKTIEILKENRGHFVGSYRRLLDFMVGTKTNIKLKWGLPRASDQKQVELKLDEATHIQSALSKQTELDDEMITITGVVTHANTETGAWTMVTGDGDHFKGVLDPKTKVKLAGITLETVTYTFICKEEVTEDALGRETTKLLLYDCPQLSQPDSNSPAPHSGQLPSVQQSPPSQP